MQENVHNLQMGESASAAPRQRLAQPALERPRALRAGFAANINDVSGSGLLHAGEQWAPAQFMITEHTHPTWEWYLQMHGVTRWYADARLWTIHPGDLFGVAPGVTHAMAQEPGANIHFYYAAFDPEPTFDRQPDLAPSWPRSESVIHLPRASSLVDPFGQLINEVTTIQNHLDVGLALALDRLVLEISRRLQQGSTSRAFDIHPAIQETQTILDRDYAGAWTLSDLADRAGLAPTYLAALFSTQLGRAPHQYLTERRIARAKQLLSNSDLSITAIAVEVGFGSGQHLARIFKKVVGATPSAYRRAH